MLKIAKYIDLLKAVERGDMFWFVFSFLEIQD